MIPLRWKGVVAAVLVLLIAVSASSTAIAQMTTYSFSFTTNLGTIGTGPSALTNRVVVGSGNPIPVAIIKGVGTYVVTNPANQSQTLTIRLTPAGSADGTYLGTTNPSSPNPAPGPLPLVPAASDIGNTPPLTHFFETDYSNYTFAGIDLAFNTPGGFALSGPLNLDYAFVLDTTVMNGFRLAERNIGFGGTLILTQAPNRTTFNVTALNRASSTASYNPLFRGLGFNVTALIFQNFMMADFLPNRVDSVNIKNMTVGFNGVFGPKIYFQGYFGGSEPVDPSLDTARYNQAVIDDTNVPGFNVPTPRLANGPAQADYDGDGKTDIVVYGYGRFAILLSGGGGVLTAFGGPADRPVVGDYDGDGKTDLAVYGYGRFAYKPSSGGPDRYIPFGGPADRPIVGDYDGDGLADPSVYGYGRFAYKPSSGGPDVYNPFGGPADRPIIGDYNGDGRTDVGVYGYGRFAFFLSGTTQFQTFGGPLDGALLASGGLFTTTGLASPGQIRSPATSLRARRKVQTR